MHQHNKRPTLTYYYGYEIHTSATASHFRAEQYRMLKGQSMMATSITNKISGQSSEGIVGANT